MKGEKMKTIAFWCVALVVLAGCSPPPPNAVINDSIDNARSGVDGSADDANDNTVPPTDNYRGPAKLMAKDAGTDASSMALQFNKVGGSAHAVPGAPVTKDQAVANSRNKVITTLTVNQAGQFTFNLALDFKGIKVTGQGRLIIQLSAFVLDAQERTVKDAQGKDLPPIISGNIILAPDAQGKLELLLPGEQNPAPLDANGNLSKTLSRPTTALPLTPGNYKLKLELNIGALAPAGQSTAGVDSATATITLQ
jgi:hypothetical protein